MRHHGGREESRALASAGPVPRILAAPGEQGLVLLLLLIIYYYYIYYYYYTIIMLFYYNYYVILLLFLFRTFPKGLRNTLLAVLIVFSIILLGLFPVSALNMNQNEPKTIKNPSSSLS